MLTRDVSSGACGSHLARRLLLRPDVQWYFSLNLPLEVLVEETDFICRACEVFVVARLATNIDVYLTDSSLRHFGASGGWLSRASRPRTLLHDLLVLLLLLYDALFGRVLPNEIAVGRVG